MAIETNRMKLANFEHLDINNNTRNEQVQPLFFFMEKTDKNEVDLIISIKYIK